MDSRHPLLLTVRALTSVLDAADPLTRGRSLRISRYAVRVARELGVPESDMVDLELGALLHDLGRSAILNDVVQSPRPLDAGERAVVQTHPTIGRDLLKDIPGLEAAAEIVWTHHERPDGAGYPRGLAADQIPIGARVIMVCAAYDAMTQDRPYRRGLSSRAACEELRRCAGQQFFPDVVNAFVQLHDSGRLWEAFSRDELEIWVRRGDLAAA
jgi:HD-GYP domain-containing protein (c-di-GMP phosphodiesterase class II)